MIVKCAHCGKELRRKPSQIKKSKSGLFFCDRNCQMKEQRIGGKLELSHYGTHTRKKNCYYGCIKCGADVVRKNSMCNDCSVIERVNLFSNSTKGELQNLSYSSANKYQKIRAHAHRIMNTIYKVEHVCEVCGYDKHVELCHIKPIGDFHDSSLLSEINSRDNLRYLCPNHHWELDNLSS